MRRSILPLAAMLPLCLAVTGCNVERTIRITSQPNGALVYLNDEEVGRTPVTVPFTFYGVYDVRLEHDGYDPLWTTHENNAPFWEYPGPDLIAVLIPGLHVRKNWHFTMTPATPPAKVNTSELLDRAAQLRQRARQTSKPPQ